MKDPNFKKILNLKYVGMVVLISACTYIAMHYVAKPVLPERDK